MATFTVLQRWTSPLAYSILLGFSPLLAADPGPLLVLSGEAVIAKDRGMLRSGEGAIVPAATVVVGLDRLPGGEAGPDAWRVRMLGGQGSQTGFVLVSQTEELSVYGEGLIDANSGKASATVELPLSVASAGDPTLIAAWELAAEAIAENEKLPEADRLSDPYFAAAAVLLAVGDSVGAADYCSKGAVYQLPEDANNAQLQLRRLSLFTDVLSGLRKVPAPVLDDESDHDGIVAARLTKASAFMAQGDYSAAERELSNALAFRSSDPLIWYLRAFCRFSEDDLVAAQSDAIIGAWLERRLPGTTRVRVGKHIERLQGSRRIWLESFRNGTAQVSLMSSDS